MRNPPRLCAAIAAIAAILTVGSCVQSGSKTGDSAGRSAESTPAAGATTSATTSARTQTPSKKPAAALPVRRPETTRTPPVDNPCGGVHVNVMVRSSAVAGDAANAERALRSVALDLVDRVRTYVVPNSLQLSPAIRLFRVTVRDRAAAMAVIARMRQEARVETAELDECNLRIQ